ncbi:MAG: hypothetical protein DCF25_16065 [Leptolyngbya foveolarum]|uniref:Uncharacterized protein n=1 Tax=Leptolyngbya foveolarum TaxID=47253 RepID=A0A2W4U335_9CYAN|nr:MAG: hypothetical protein DCF25_16065 [Leptolyngbya foveolarum]
MRKAKSRLTAIALPLMAALVLAADLAQPGWGRFPNPLFYSKAVVNGTIDKFSNADVVNPDDARLKGCEGEANTATITDAQAAIRKTLAGKTSSFAVQSLGSPACQLANGSYRWLLESGLSLDASVNPDGTINDAALSR